MCIIKAYSTNGLCYCKERQIGFQNINLAYYKEKTNDKNYD